MLQSVATLLPTIADDRTRTSSGGVGFPVATPSLATRVKRGGKGERKRSVMNEREPHVNYARSFTLLSRSPPGVFFFFFSFTRSQTPNKNADKPNATVMSQSFAFI